MLTLNATLQEFYTPCASQDDLQLHMHRCRLTAVRFAALVPERFVQRRGRQSANQGADEPSIGSVRHHSGSSVPPPFSKADASCACTHTRHPSCTCIYGHVPLRRLFLLACPTILSYKPSVLCWKTHAVQDHEILAPNCLFRVFYVVDLRRLLWITRWKGWLHNITSYIIGIGCSFVRGSTVPTILAGSQQKLVALTAAVRLLLLDR